MHAARSASRLTRASPRGLHEDSQETLRLRRGAMQIAAAQIYDWMSWSGTAKER
jgi:hypothetical protein